MLIYSRMQLADVLIKRFSEQEIRLIMKDKDCPYFIYFNLNAKIKSIYVQLLLDNVTEEICMQRCKMKHQELASYLHYNPMIKMCQNDRNRYMELLKKITMIDWYKQGKQKKFYINLDFLEALMTKKQVNLGKLVQIKNENYNFLKQITYQSLIQCQGPFIIPCLYLTYDFSKPLINLREIILFIGRTTRQRIVKIFDQIIRIQVQISKQGTKQDRAKIFINLIRLIRLSPKYKYSYGDNLKKFIKLTIKQLAELKLAALDGNMFVLSDLLYQFPIRDYAEQTYDFHLVLEPTFKAYLMSYHEIPLFYLQLFSNLIKYDVNYLPNFVPGLLDTQKLAKLSDLGLTAEQIMKFLCKFIKLKPKNLNAPQKYQNIQFLRQNEFQDRIPSLICQTLHLLQVKEQTEIRRIEYKTRTKYNKNQNQKQQQQFQQQWYI